MKILFDLNHPVDVNFFKASMIQLKEEDDDVYVIYRDRGKLERIIRYEIPIFPIKEIGTHQKGFVNKVISQLKRDYDLISYFKKEKFDLIVCFGPTSVLSAKYCNIPYLAFEDDFEYKIPFYHANIFATRHIFPDFIKFNNSRTFTYHGFKELAYLHPELLKTSDKVLKEYSIVKNEYVFIREISNISLNYKDESTILKKLVKLIKNKGFKIVLSIENKDLKEAFQDSCIILEEPVSDIYSLIYHSVMTVSSGDTVAREAALLGVPTIYTGGRKMVMNDALVNKGLLNEAISSKEVIEIFESIIANENKNKEEAVSIISKEWVNTTKIILDHIGDFKIKSEQ